MQFDIFDTAVPPRVIRFTAQTQSLVVVVDGSGSWGSGEEAAELGREYLAALWREASSWSVAQVVAGVLEAGARSLQALRDDPAACGYSVTALLCSAETVVSVAAGHYRVDVLGGGARVALYRPKRLIDLVASNGSRSTGEADDYPHGDIYVGSYVGDAEAPHLETATHTLLAGQVVVVSNDARVELERTTGKVAPVRAKAVVLECGLVADPGPIVLAMR